MGHSVCYVVDVPGTEFNAIAGSWNRASQEEIETLCSTGTLWDGDSLSPPMSFLAELTGVVTIVWLTTKYTAFLTHQPSAAAVLEWENVALKPFADRRVARLDEFVLEQWESFAGEYWFRHQAVCENFWEWLGGHDNTTWTLLAP